MRGRVESQTPEPAEVEVCRAFARLIRILLESGFSRLRVLARGDRSTVSGLSVYVPPSRGENAVWLNDPGLPAEYESGPQSTVVTPLHRLVLPTGCSPSCPEGAMPHEPSGAVCTKFGGTGWPKPSGENCGARYRDRNKRPARSR